MTEKMMHCILSDILHDVAVSGPSDKAVAEILETVGIDAKPAERAQLNEILIELGGRNLSEDMLLLNLPGYVNRVLKLLCLVPAVE